MPRSSALRKDAFLGILAVDKMPVVDERRLGFVATDGVDDIPICGAGEVSRQPRSTGRAISKSAIESSSVSIDVAAIANERAVMNSNKALWEKGDFTEIAAFMRQSGEAVVESLAISPPLRVLDLGCGDGTTAIPLAVLGAEVVGIDIARNLVDAGNKRAAQVGLDRLTFREGDACDLQGVDDDSFDLTLSMFGAMFAPKPFDVAREMVRVTRPGGRIVMGNWIPNDATSFVSQLLKISSSFTPPPPEGFVSPMTWGVDAHIVERFSQAGVPKENLSMVKDTFHFRSPDRSPAQFIESFRRFYGPTMNAFEAAQKSGTAEELHSRLLELAVSHNKSTDTGISIPATFLRVTVCV